jgi:hypothetical protein
MGYAWQATLKIEIALNLKTLFFLEGEACPAKLDKAKHGPISPYRLRVAGH